jgi:protein FAM32A
MPTVIGGKLKLKGLKSSSSSSNGKKRKKSSKCDKDEKKDNVEKESDNVMEEPKYGNPPVLKDDGLTDTERKHKAKLALKLEKELKNKLTAVSYRDRLDEFNSKLATLTEHNDIPRVSAAGNG